MSQTVTYATGIAIIKMTQKSGNRFIMVRPAPVRLYSPGVAVTAVVTDVTIVPVRARPTIHRRKTEINPPMLLDVSDIL